MSSVFNSMVENTSVGLSALGCAHKSLSPWTPWANAVLVQELRQKALNKAPVTAQDHDRLHRAA